MKRIQFALPLLLLLAVGFVLAGCPKDDKMMKGDASRPAVEHIG
jgi:hypothetical protein